MLYPKSLANRGQIIASLCVHLWPGIILCFCLTKGKDKVTFRSCFSITQTELQKLHGSGNIIVMEKKKNKKRKYSLNDFYREYAIWIFSCNSNFQLEIFLLKHKGPECQQLPLVIYTCCKFKLLQPYFAFISMYFPQVHTAQRPVCFGASEIVLCR